MEVRGRVAEDRFAECQKAFHVPMLYVRLAGIDVDGEVEEIRDEHRRVPASSPAASLQNVQPLDDDDVGLSNDLKLARDNVVREVGILGCRYLRHTGFHVGHELEEPPHVVTLGKPFPV
jgi:hypothetical protein